MSINALGSLLTTTDYCRHHSQGLFRPGHHTHQVRRKTPFYRPSKRFVHCSSQSAQSISAAISRLLGQNKMSSCRAVSANPFKLFNSVSLPNSGGTTGGLRQSMSMSAAAAYRFRLLLTEITPFQLTTVCDAAHHGFAAC